MGVALFVVGWLLYVVSSCRCCWLHVGLGVVVGGCELCIGCWENGRGYAYLYLFANFLLIEFIYALNLGVSSFIISCNAVISCSERSFLL